MRAIALVASKPRWRTVPGCRGDRNQHNSRGVRPVRQQGVNAQCQPFGQHPSQDQRLSLLVRVDQSAQELVVRGGGDCQRETVWPRRRDGERTAVDHRALGDKSGRAPTRAARNHGIWRRAAGRPPPLPSPRSPQGESGGPRAQQRRALANLWTVTSTLKSAGPARSDCVILDKRWR